MFVYLQCLLYEEQELIKASINLFIVFRLLLSSGRKGTIYSSGKIRLIMHLRLPFSAQGIYNRAGIKCKNGRLEIASQIIDCFYFVDQIFAQFFLLDGSCIYSAHVGT